MSNHAGQLWGEAVIEELPDSELIGEVFLGEASPLTTSSDAQASSLQQPVLKAPVEAVDTQTSSPQSTTGKLKFLYEANNKLALTYHWASPAVTQSILKSATTSPKSRKKTQFEQTAETKVADGEASPDAKTDSQAAADSPSSQEKPYKKKKSFLQIPTGRKSLAEAAADDALMPTTPADAVTFIMSDRLSPGDDAACRDYMGKFTKTEITLSSTHMDRPIYKNGNDKYLYYWSLGATGEWLIGNRYNGLHASFRAKSGAVSPEAACAWERWDGSEWFEVRLTANGTHDEVGDSNLSSEPRPGLGTPQAQLSATTTTGSVLSPEPRLSAWNTLISQRHSNEPHVEQRPPGSAAQRPTPLPSAALVEPVVPPARTDLSHDSQPGSASSSRPLLQRFVTTDRFAQDASWGSTPGIANGKRACMLFGALFFAFAVFRLCMHEGTGYHEELVAAGLVQQTRHILCSASGSDIATSGTVYLNACQAKTNHPVFMSQPGFEEVLKSHSHRKALATEMIVEHNTRRRGGGWKRVSKEGGLEAWSYNAHDVSFGPYKLSDDIFSIIPGTRLKLDLTEWQKKTPSVDGLGYDGVGGWPGKPNIAQDWSNWTFNASTMQVNPDENYIWSGDTRVSFWAAFEESYSAIGGASRDATSGDSLFGYARTGDGWIGTVCLMYIGEASFESITSRYLQASAVGLWWKRFSDGWKIWYGLWALIWPASALACCLNFAARSIVMEGCADQRGFSTCFRALVIAIVATILISWGSWLFFHNGPFVSITSMTCVFGLFLLLDSAPVVITLFRSLRLSAAGYDPVEPQGETPSAHDAENPGSPSSLALHAQSESGSPRSEPKPPDYSFVATYCALFLIFFVVAIMANVAFAVMMRSPMKIS